MKGLELPISTVVIVAMAVLVLVVVSAFFLSQSGLQFSEIYVRSRFNQECTSVKCTAEEAKSLETEKADLYKLCQSLYGDKVTTPACLQACGCREIGEEIGSISAEDINKDTRALLSDDPFLKGA